MQNGTAIKVDTDIPMPGVRLGRKRKYPWREMRVGDSFAVSAVEKDNVRTSASYFASRHNHEFKFSILKTGDAYRCWRTA